MREREVGDARPAAHALPFTARYVPITGTITEGSGLVVPALRLPFSGPPLILLARILAVLVVILLLVVTDIMVL